MFALRLCFNYIPDSQNKDLRSDLSRNSALQDPSEEEKSTDQENSTKMKEFYESKLTFGA